VGELDLLIHNFQISDTDTCTGMAGDTCNYVVSPPIQLKYIGIFAASLEIDMYFNNNMLQKTRNITKIGPQHNY